MQVGIRIYVLKFNKELEFEVHFISKSKLLLKLN